jgi:hypothetical protein
MKTSVRSLNMHNRMLGKLLLGLAGLILVGHSVREFMTTASDASFCAMTYMWPAFEEIKDVPPTGIQALDTKYKLYLYREMDGRQAGEVFVLGINHFKD